MKAKQLPSGNYRCRAYNKYTGKTKSFTASTKKEAERLARLYYMQSVGEPVLTVSEAIETYIQDRSAILSPTTLRDYKSFQKQYFTEINKVQLNMLTDVLVQRWVNKLAENHSPKTVRNIFGFLTAVIRSQTPQKTFLVVLPKKVRRDNKLPTERDIRSLLAYVKDTPMETVIELAVFCCMRKGEICALRPEDIHSTYISVRHNMVRSNNEWILKPTKTYSSSRDIPCPSFLIEKLKQGTPNLSPAQLQSKWYIIQKKLGLQFRFHDLRHFSASLMLTVMPKVDCEKYGGWQHGSNVLDSIYTYNIQESLSVSAQKWNAKIEELRK